MKIISLSQMDIKIPRVTRALDDENKIFKLIFSIEKHKMEGRKLLEKWAWLRFESNLIKRRYGFIPMKFAKHLITYIYNISYVFCLVQIKKSYTVKPVLLTTSEQRLPVNYGHLNLIPNEGKTCTQRPLWSISIDFFGQEINCIFN